MKYKIHTDINIIIKSKSLFKRSVKSIKELKSVRWMNHQWQMSWKT